MENILTFQNIITFVFILFYGMIFFVQKSQFKKQNEIIDKYDKIFNIINIDEIEKYVDLQKKSTELSYFNRERKLSNLENKFNKVNEDIDAILESSKTNLEKSDEIHIKINEVLNKANETINKSKTFNTNLYEFNVMEFNEFYQILEKKLTELNDKKILKEITKELLNIQNKYRDLKEDELKKI
jgi:ElaB/YqjD/DUF883 family membrane-anchored ribosome-binding protein